MMSTSLPSSESSSLDFMIKSSDDTLLNMLMDDCVLIDFEFIDEYKVNARSESPVLLLFPVDGVVCLVPSPREKSTGSRNTPNKSTFYDTNFDLNMK